MNRRTFVKGSLAGAALALAPINIRPARAAGITRQTILQFRGVGLVAQRWAKDPGFLAAVQAWDDPIACLGQLYNGIYDTYSWAPVPRNRMLLLWDALSFHGWPAVLNLLTRTYQFQHPGEAAVYATGYPRVPGDHIWVALKRYKQIELLYKAFVVRPPTAVEAGQVLGALIETTPPQIAAASWLATASAQDLTPLILEMQLPPIYVQDSLMPDSVHLITPGTAAFDTFITGLADFMRRTGPGNYATLQDAVTAYQRSLGPTPPVVLSNPEDALFGGAATQKVMAELAQRGVTEAEQLAILVALSAAVGLIPTGALVGTTGLGMIAEGLAMGTIGLVVLHTSVGVMVTLIGVGMILFALYTVTIVVNHMIPAVPGTTGFPLPSGYTSLPATSTAIIDVPAAWAAEAATYPEADADANAPYQWEE